MFTSLLNSFITRRGTQSLIPGLQRTTRTVTTATMLTPFLESKRPKESPEFDYSTLSNYRSFKVLHTTLNLEISFDKSTISGDVIYKLAKLNPENKEVHLDTSYLVINKVEIDGKTVPNFHLEPRREPLGSKLVIEEPETTSNEFTLKLEFETTSQCTALQWLGPEQTSGKPYVFSQLEAIHARSLFPCFDTPSIKSTFTANIVSPLPVVFSGIATPKPAETTTPYQFEQRIPIPAYLIGIASGDLVSAPIGPRSAVYTEPFRLKDAQWEFNGDVERFIQTAESIIFPYEWTRYDVLVNVNSYPYGGMESPNMTFATPTLIAHDKSNIDVIAHELAHSWSGNLVTNCSWNHFWLNEGWTVYLERRIVGALHGEAERHFSALIGWDDLRNSIDGMRNPERFSTLVQCLNDGTDPDDAFSTVPYEKGFNLLFYLEQLVGGTEQFDPFIKHYFTKFSKKSLDTFQFLDTLFEFFSDKRELLESVDWETWLFKPGMPPKPKFITTLADAVYDLADRWVLKAQAFSGNGGKDIEARFDEEFNPKDVEGFNSNQIVLFLETLAQKNETVDGFLWENYPVAANSLLRIYNEKIVKSQNAEVTFKVFKFEVVARLAQHYGELADWLGTVGRMKFVRPSYKLLDSVDRELALKTFERWQGTYHPICRSLVKQDLQI